MSDLKPCPFCGHKADDHADDCYIRLFAISLSDSLIFGDASMHAHVSQEELRCAWNTRAERTCEPIKKFSEESPWPKLVCSECGRHLHFDDAVDENGIEYSELQPYCGCGARVERGES